jgi:predicted O-methyltransferase YrrM
MTADEALQATAHIPSGVTDAEARLLYRLASEAHRLSRGSVVEIGAYLGRSTIVLGAAGRVHSIDHHRGNTEHQLGRPRCRPGTVVDGCVDTYPAFLRNVRAAGVASNVIAIVADHLTGLSSMDPTAFPVALLFVDAEHSYVATTSIIESWIPRTDGVVLFHDYCAEFPEVVSAVDDAGLGEMILHIDTTVGFRVQ